MIELFPAFYTVLHILFLAALVLCALAVFFLKDLIAAAISFSAFSFLMALEFFILQAPDVAIAEASIGAGISTAILIIGIRGTKRQESDEP
ncbi:MAG TPA: hydrogenase subunit MbhD domain-containing protein [Methanocorpusculum sp.]|nr:hydrogenase subunit MbhD domain-containing protein [Methanocorpusculum sp.]